METITILIRMDLGGQAKRKRHGQAGYAMAALLVAMSIMAIMLTVAMPVWKQTSRREKEEELVFRGKQYAHAIGLFQKKFANAYPPNLDVLVDQRFLRKKFKDPITNDDFVPIAAGQNLPGGTQQPGAAQQPGGLRGAPGSATPGGIGQPTQPGSATQPGGAGRIGGPPISAGSTGQTSGGIQGVTSKSKEQSIRLYNGRGHYNEWAFVYIQQQQAAGAGAAGSATPGAGTGAGAGRGNRGGSNPPTPGGVNPPGGGRGGPGGRSGPGGGRGNNGGIGTFGSGGVQPPTPRGRF
jgi:type II secretory pathway pseudopilin PulG